MVYKIPRGGKPYPASGLVGESAWPRNNSIDKKVVGVVLPSQQVFSHIVLFPGLNQ